VPYVLRFHGSSLAYVGGQPTIENMTARRPGRGIVLGAASGCVVLGHWFTYIFVDPSAEVRASLLTRTGHAYLSAASQLALDVTLAALALLFLKRLASNERGAPTFGVLGRRLAGFQVGAFLAMEVVERLASGSPLGELSHGALIPLGIAVQIVLAGLGAAVILRLLRTADVAAELLARAPRVRAGADAEVMHFPADEPASVALVAALGRAPPPPR
jgi:hypothetical protein